MNILITAGPTWVKVDAVRILTSIFTGKTGLYFAKELAKKNHKVTLVINPFRLSGQLKVTKNLTIVPFYYFQELKAVLVKLLTKNKYDLIIHNAAVSDYKLEKPFTGKIPSKNNNLSLDLVPTEKLIKVIRSRAPKAILISFKLETDKNNLLTKAYASLKENNSDFVVANLLSDVKSNYKAWIINKAGKTRIVNSLINLGEVLQTLIIAS